MDAETFWTKVDRNDPDECWTWTGRVDRDGYGRVYFDRKPRLAHRLAHFLTHDDWADGYELDHLCRVRDCVNPAHLEPVTHTENVVRAIRLKTACIHGHEYNEVNTKYTISKVSGRRLRACKICWRAAAARQNQRKKSA